MSIDGEETTESTDDGTLLNAGETTSEETTLSDDKSEGDKSDAKSKGDAEETAEEKADDAEDTSSEESEGDDADSDDEAETVSYDDLTTPEDMPIDEAQFTEFKDLAAKMNDGKGLGLADTQMLVDFRAEMIKSETEGWTKTFDGWRKDMFADREIGGKEKDDNGVPVNYTKNVKPAVLAALEEFGDAETTHLFKTQRAFGEHPGLTRLLFRVGSSLQQDTIVRGRVTTVDDQDAKQRRLYPSHYNADGSPKGEVLG